MAGESTAEAAFAVNLRTARVRSGLTQAELAEQMAAAGFKWHPATVYKVESGDRQIQLGEALELTRILAVPIAEMTSSVPSEKLARRAAIIAAANRHAGIDRDFRRALDAFIESFDGMQRLVADSRRDLDELFDDSDTVDALRSVLRRSRGIEQLRKFRESIKETGNADT